MIRRVALLLLLSLCAASTFGQVSRDRVAFSSTGQPIRNANVWVCSGNVQVLFGPIPPCQGPLATIYSDPGLTRQVTQPLPTDANGNYLYYVSTGGTYTEVVTAVGFTGWSAVLTYACTPGSTCTWTQTQTFAVPIVSTVSTGTAPLSIASTTVVPNLNAQLHNGKTAPAGNIVGDSDTQPVTNKTLNGTGNGNAVTLLNFQPGASAVTGNSSDQTLYSFSIPANQIGAGKGMRVSAGFLHNLGSASITYKLILGSTTVCTYSASGGTLTENWQFEIINNPGVQNAQTARSTVFDGTTYIGCFSNNWTTAENLANADTIKATFNVANTDQVTPKFWLVELIQ